MAKMSSILVLFLLCAWATLVAAAVARNLSPREAMALLVQRPSVFLLDVRTPAEFREAHLDGARLIPVDQLGSRLAEIPRDRPVLIYCAVGSRSAQAFSLLARRGYPEVYNLDGGISAWAAQGLPIRR